MDFAIEYPIDWVLAGERRILPSVYIDGAKVELNREYPVKLRFVRNVPPKKRPEGSIIALYMLLYLVKSKPVIKLGSVSMFSNSSAAMLWAQAPVYARIVGVFHLTKSIDLEELENFGYEKLTSSKYANIFKFVTRRNERDSLFNSRRIVEMWLKPFWNDMEKHINEVDNAAKFLLDAILKNVEYVEILYDGASFEAPQRFVEVSQNFKTFNSLKNMLKKNCKGIKGLFKVTPVGLCIFTPMNENDTDALYIDICREFVYNVDVFLIRKEDEVDRVQGAGGYD